MFSIENIEATIRSHGSFRLILGPIQCELHSEYNHVTIKLHRFIKMYIFKLNIIRKHAHMRAHSYYLLITSSTNCEFTGRKGSISVNLSVP